MLIAMEPKVSLNLSKSVNRPGIKLLYTLSLLCDVDDRKILSNL